MYNSKEHYILIQNTPDSWNVTRNKFIFKISKKVVGANHSDFQLLSMGKSGVNPRDIDNGEGKFPESFENYQVVEPNDIIFCLFDMDETPRTVGYSELHGMITSAYDVVQCFPNIDPKFIYYVYLSIDNKKGLRPYYTGLRKVVKPETFMGLKIKIPSYSEQKTISRFLDEKLKIINSKIIKNRKLIKLLKEKKQITINRTITKGLDSSVTMKYSGISWIGKIPSKWNIKPMRYLGVFSNGISKSSEFFGEGYPFLTYSDVYNNDVVSIPTGFIKSTSEDWKTYSINYGDIFFTRTSETNDDIGVSSVCFKTIEKSSFSGFLIRFRPTSELLDVGYSRYFFRSHVPLIHFSKEMTQVTRSSLSQGLIKRTPIILPPINEQKQITDFLNNKIPSIDNCILKVELHIKKLKEFQDVLISSSVCGRIPRIS